MAVKIAHGAISILIPPLSLWAWRKSILPLGENL